MKKIPLRNRKGAIRAYALVDDEDYEKLIQFRWCLSTGYAITGRTKTWKGSALMHRFILDCPKDQMLDHRNMNRLDNRKKNLRICTRQENGRNCKVSKSNTSGFKGVCWNSRDNLWVARVGNNYRNVFVGSFKRKEDAIKAHAKKCKELHKEFARLK